MGDTYADGYADDYSAEDNGQVDARARLGPATSAVPPHSIGSGSGRIKASRIGKPKQ